VVIEPDCPPPSPRVNASLVPHVTPKATELILFGGEYTDLGTGKVHVNADLYRFDCDKAKWARVRAPSRRAGAGGGGALLRAPVGLRAGRKRALEEGRGRRRSASPAPAPP
jgi:hypothetical protein